jgi:hypothetical protein
LIREGVGLFDAGVSPRVREFGVAVSPVVDRAEGDSDAFFGLLPLGSSGRGERCKLAGSFLRAIPVASKIYYAQTLKAQESDADALSPPV